MKKKYLYLAKEEFVDTWVNGGSIPLSVASTYLKADRGGIYTPDENKIDRSTHSLDMLKPFIGFPQGVGVDLKIRNCRFAGVDIDDATFDVAYEDGLILCLANSLSKKLAARLDKVACVCIDDIAKLKGIIDQQLGVEGEMGNCQYTKSHHRDHFTKSHHDSWQQEFRIFWKEKENQCVEIPKGISTRCKI